MRLLEVTLWSNMPKHGLTIRFEIWFKLHNSKRAMGASGFGSMWRCCISTWSPPVDVFWLWRWEIRPVFPNVGLHAGKSFPIFVLNICWRVLAPGIVLASFTYVNNISYAASILTVGQTNYTFCLLTFELQFWIAQEGSHWWWQGQRQKPEQRSGQRASKLGPRKNWPGLASCKVHCGGKHQRLNMQRTGGMEFKTSNCSTRFSARLIVYVKDNCVCVFPVSTVVRTMVMTVHRLARRYWMSTWEPGGHDPWPLAQAL